MGVCDVTASAIETDANMNSRRRHIAAPGLWDGLLGDSPPAELGLPSPTKFSPADDLSSVEPPSDAGTNHARLPSDAGTKHATPSSDAGTKHATPSSDAGTKHATLPTVNGATLGRRDGLKEKGSVFRARIKWPDLVVQLFIHIGCLYGFYLFLYARLYTLIWAFLVVYSSGFGITAGAHRLWSHRAYKARWPLKLLLIVLFTVSGQRHVYAWALDHRVHHKFSETDADPHNAKRGFLFSHVGWLVLTPHPDVVAKRALVDMSDLEEDMFVVWHKRLYVPLFAIFVLAVPVLVPWYFWDETLWNCFFVMFNSRFCITLNIAFFVNSVAHMWGNRPYDKSISPVENLAVSLAALGEGWHNYHHVFPWDYKTAELGDYTFNLTTAFIDMFAKIGWAYDLKTVSPDMVKRRVERSGDGSHELWGWGDKDMSEEDRREFEEEDSRWFEEEETVVRNAADKHKVL